ncbi:hypothetical protein [Labrys wisconsinensis]|uniref:Uncharacterized protein n=1 Tax=Labrys wisconsinensis TaxID=425677 RepID=A0ABU0J5Y9_9HYPH|nr:hypothetical protein [Labrys wisconsinensis]MDQ0468976.1 hypothetical protein [Labrys wisconsinensis]
MRLCSVLLLGLLAAPPAWAGNACGLRPDDWCPAPAGDACGRHADVESCRRDQACTGMAYRGESLIACRRDERGFGLNCPTVGCKSRSPEGRTDDD